MRLIGWVRLIVLVSWLVVLVTVRRLVKGPRHPSWRWRVEISAELLRREISASVGRPMARLRAIIPSSPIHPLVLRKVIHRKRPLGGAAAEVIAPRSWSDERTTMLYLHGGGYVVCGPRTHRDLIARVALATGARCVAPVYRLAPEHPFPAAVDDAVAAYCALLAEGVRPERLIVGGDSAGGGLTLAMMLRLRDAGMPLPSRAVLLSPWVDLTCTGASIDANRGLDFLAREPLEFYAAAYLGDTPGTDPLASPLHAPLAGLPPLLLLTGSAESFHSEALALVDRAREAGVDVQVHVGDGMIHVWPAFASLFPEARAAFDVISAYVSTA